ncbi:MAG: FixH family protein [Flavipsychrobacter sp.]|nr:FixH family protein [Flavipsychrobacter sp.]
MKISWGIRIAIVYSGFVLLILTLVIASMHQHFDLVSANYYDEEVAYQKVINAGKNEATLSTPINVHANADKVTIEFPAELQGKEAKGEIRFYSPVNSAWDTKYNVAIVDHSMSIERSKLRNTKYIVKIDLTDNGKRYYQETEINLHS